MNDTTTSTAVIDLSYLEMMADGDADMKKTLIDMIAVEMPPELEKLRVAVLARDGEQLRQVAHKMKSTLAFVGNPTMTAANAELERMGKEGEVQAAARHLETLEREAAAVMPALQAESAKFA